MAKQVNGAIYYGIGLDNKQLKTDALQSQRILQGIGDTAVSEGARIDNTFRNLAKSAGLVFGTQQVIQFGRSIVQVRGEFQKLETAFGVLLGNKAQADKLMADAVTLASTTPFGLQDVSAGAKQLLAYGFATEDIIEDLRRLGDVSAGLGLPLERLTYLYGTTMTQGRLYTRDLMQFTTSGIPLLRALADQFGVAEGEVQKLVEAGEVGFPEVQKAIYAMTGEGGQFNNMMGELSKTIPGQIEKLKDAWQVMLNDIGKGQQGVIAGSVDAAAYLVENYETVGKVIVGLITTYGAYKAAIIANSVALGIQQQMLLQTALSGQALTKWQALQAVVTTRLTKLQAMFNKTALANPYVLVTTLVVGLVAAMWSLSDSTTAAERAQERLNKRQQEFDDREKDRRSRIDELIRIIQDETQTLYAQKTAYEELQKLSPAITEAYKREQLAVADLADANKALNAEQDKRNTEKLISDINDTRNAIEQLTRWRDAASKAPGQTYAIVASYDKQISEQKAALSILEKNLEDHNRRVAEAEFDALPPAEKIRIKEEQLAKIRSEFERVNAVINEEMAKFPREAPQEIRIPLRIETTGGQQPSGWQMPTFSSVNTVDLAQARADALRSEEQATQAEIDALKAANTKKSKLSADEIKRLADEARRRREQAQRDAEALKKLEAKFADDVAQARIDAMKDGLEKTLAQNELNYQRELAQIKEQEEALLAARQKTLKKGETATLSDAEQAGFATRRGSAATERDRANAEARKKEEKRIKEERDAALEGFRSFEQEYLRLYEEFQEKRKKAEAKGADAAGLANADAVFEKSIQDLASRFAENNPEFAEWATGIDNLVNNATESGAQAIIDKAIEDLKAALASAKATVSSLMEGGIDAGEGEAYGQALARIVKLEAELKALQSDSASKKVNSGWKKTYSTLNKVADEFGEIGDQIGGTAGEAIRLASTVATSTISMINGIKTVTGVAAASMSALEKASVILTVISAAFQIAMAIASLFNDDKAKEKQIERLQGEIDSLRWELENADVLRLQKDSGIDFLKTIRDTYAQTRDEVISLHGETGMYYKNADDWYERLMNRLLEMAHYEEIVEKSAGKLADTYANIDYAAGKALGEERYKNARSELENLAEQQLKIQEQIDAENSKKKTDKSKVKDWEHEIQELGEEAAALINDIVEEIVGGSATDIASQLGDAFFDAFEAGEDAAKAWGDTVNDIVGDIMRRMLVQKFVEERVGAIFDKYKNVWFPDGKFAGTDAILGSMAGLTDDLNGVGEAFSVIWDSLPDEIKNLIGGNGADEASREASSKGITSVSQDSFEEYLGRVTAIQGHTFSIAESSKTLVAQSAQILQVLSGIRDDTRYLSRLEVMEGDIRAMRSAISDIDLKGIKLRQ
ncbi:tape measure protein [Alistipes sp.]|uniref:tape measure protein n=1 Tax=Alistipes sp. TaxID=1872444 RepID=UPI003528D433